MKKFTGVLVLAGLAFLAPRFADAQKVAVPERVPGNVKAIISINDTNKMWGALGKSPVRAAFDRISALPSVQGSPEYQDFKLQLDKAELDLGFSLAPDKLLGETVKGLDFYVVKAGDGAAPEMLAILRLKDNASAQAIANYIEKETTRQSDELKSAGAQPIKVAKSAIEGLNFNVTSIPEENLHYGVQNDLLLVGTSVDLLKDSLTSAGGERLKALPDLASGFAAAGSPDGEMLVYLDKTIVGDLQALAPGSSDAALNSFRTGSTTAVFGFTPTAITTDVFKTVSDVATESEKKLLSIPPGPQSENLSLMAAEPLMAFAMNLFDGPLMKKVMDEEIARNAQAQSAMGGVMDGLKSMETKTGLSLDNDILPAFGPEVAFSVNALSMDPATGGFDLDIVGAIGVKDADKAQKILTALEANATSSMTEKAKAFDPNAPSVQVVVEDYNGTEIRSIPASNPMIPIPLALTYARTTDGTLIGGISVSSVKKALDRRAGSATGVPVTAWLGDAGATNQVTVVSMRQVGNSLQSVLPTVMAFAGGGAAARDQASLDAFVAAIKSFGVISVTQKNSPAGSRMQGTVNMAP